MKSLWLLFLAYTNIANIVLASPINLEIIEGKNASINDYPWLVSLYENDTGFLCGGFLVSSSWIVTAAHCINPIDLYYIRAGSNSTSSGGTVVQISETISHPNFSWSTLDNDIAVLHLETPVTGDHIQPVDLPDPQTVVPAGDIIQAAGWGLIDETNQIYPDTLQEIDIPAVGIEKCREIYGNSWITDNMLCVGYLNGEEKGPCSCDSRSPLMWNGMPIGIVSWARECASSVYPTVITKVSNYRDWIRNNTGI